MEFVIIFCPWSFSLPVGSWQLAVGSCQNIPFLFNFVMDFANHNRELWLPFPSNCTVHIAHWIQSFHQIYLLIYVYIYIFMTFLKCSKVTCQSVKRLPFAEHQSRINANYTRILANQIVHFPYNIIFSFVYVLFHILWENNSATF